MALATQTKWEVVPSVPKYLADAPTSWPSPIHQQHSFTNGPPRGPIMEFVATSQIRSALFNALSIGPNSRRLALKRSGNLWYLEAQSYNMTPFEKLVRRHKDTVNGHVNGRYGLRYASKPHLFIPTALVGGVWAWRWYGINVP
eukprot:TRINITY_DN1542_c0_g1_i1.p1 TRINITY_DN1542_c0_g1~~TRINITY_DN1542_c0_g1_i1.p1  ORF type:complete len:143 (+),score=6.12 TRINITY_DN1542_c0_g1_i1:50-478(+)